jgi:SpoVK/Ycf46/Vps4 family AAA+-type ATPase
MGAQFKKMPDGRCELRFENGDYYLGEMSGNAITGEGIYRYADGRVYEGQFVNGAWHGFGKATFTDGSCYEGDWVQNIRQGQGKCSWSDGTRYEGSFDGDLFHGKGTMYYADGRIYDGGWDHNDWHGYGKAIFQNEGETYEGDWVHNVRQGHGIRTFSDPSGVLLSREEGEFANNQLWGQTQIRWNDGSELTGVIHGYEPVGIVRMQYGDRHSDDALRSCLYEGPMVIINQAFNKQGEGTFTDARGVVYKGPFDKDQKEGIFEITYPDGSSEAAEFRGGAKVREVRERTWPARQARQGDDSPDRGMKGPGENRTMEAPKKAGGPALKKGENFLKAGSTGNERYSPEIQPYFEGVIGMHSVKEQLDSMYKRLRIDAMRQQTLGMSGDQMGYYFILTGNPGTGKTTVARIIGRMLHDLGFLPADTYIEVDRSRIVGQYIGQTAIKTSEVIDSARGGTLFIDEAYSLYKKGDEKDFGTEAIDTLLKDMEDHRGQYCVILAGYREPMRDLIRNANPGLASRFDRKIHIEDYSPEELVDILVSMADQKGFLIPKEAKQVILARIGREKVDDTFDNARFARRLLDEAIEKQAIRLSENLKDLRPEDLQVLEAEDFGSADGEESTLEGCMEKLNSLVGLEQVKEEVNGFVRAVRIQNESRKRGLSIAANPIPMNMVFAGNPGTGKTTVARLLSRIYYHLGLLKRPDVYVECVRADLVGRYQGETALKVKDVVRSALGGILFIDEAYSLVAGDGDTFGTEAVNTLVSEIENNRENLAVILAGYTDRMQEFLDSNPGLRSRLPRIVEFADYTAEELTDIFFFDLKGRGYNVEVPRQKVLERLQREMEAKDFGNARGVRNLCDKVIAGHNERINRMDLSALSNEAIVTITEEDMAD